MMNICFIPARGGSKRIPRKNIRIFRGKPMISWPISQALESKSFDKIIVSTDDEEIANIAIKQGAEVPFLRPSKLSDDFCPTQEVILHGINWLEENNYQINIVCCLYATAPFVQSNDLKNAMTLLKSNNKDSFVFTATSFDFPIQRAIKIYPNGYSKMLDSKNYLKRSQDLEIFYHDAGQFYIGKKDTWINNKNFFEGGMPLLIPRWRVQDIDDMEDWIRAEKIHQSIF